MRIPLIHRLTLLRGRRRKWLVALACGVGCIAALVLAGSWYNTAATEEGGPLRTLDDLRGVRGPRDLWDFMSGESGRRRREILRFMAAEEELIRRHLQQVKALQESGAEGVVDEPEMPEREPRD
jgi:hypothetical protein